MGTLVGGCSIFRPKVISSARIPTHLVDDATHPALYGNYASPPGDDMSSCRQEVKRRGKDVINLLITVRNNNAELKAIRTLNQ